MNRENKTRLILGGCIISGCLAYILFLCGYSFKLVCAMMIVTMIVDFYTLIKWDKYQKEEWRKKNNGK